MEVPYWPQLKIELHPTPLYINKMQTAFHILSLVKELNDAILDGTITGTEFYKKERTALLIIKQSQRVALSFQFHPAKAGVFVVPASKITVDTREKPWPIFKIDGAKIIGISQIGFDRIFRIDIVSEGKKQGLIFEVLGPNGNLWLVDDQDKIQATLRNREYDASSPYQPFEISGKLNPLDVTVEHLRGMGEQKPDSTVTFLLEKSLLGCTRLLAAEIVKRSGLDEDIEGSELNDLACEKLFKGIEQVVSFFRNPETGYLYQIRGIFEPLPFKLSSTEKQPEKFKTLSLAVMMSTEIRQEQVEKRDEEKTIKDAVARAAKRLDRRLVRLEQDITQAADFDSYRKWGELLQINFDKLKRGLNEIQLEDVYSHDGESIKISLDPALTPTRECRAVFQEIPERARRIRAARAKTRYHSCRNAGTSGDPKGARDKLCIGPTALRRRTGIASAIRRSQAGNSRATAVQGVQAFHRVDDIRRAGMDRTTTEPRLISPNRTNSGFTPSSVPARMWS